jgi:hypothetical protein
VVRCRAIEIIGAPSFCPWPFALCLLPFGLLLAKSVNHAVWLSNTRCPGSAAATPNHWQARPFALGHLPFAFWFAFGKVCQSGRLAFKHALPRLRCRDIESLASTSLCPLPFALCLLVCFWQSLSIRPSGFQTCAAQAPLPRHRIIGKYVLLPFAICPLPFGLRLAKSVNQAVWLSIAGWPRLDPRRAGRGSRVAHRPQHSFL